MPSTTFSLILLFVSLYENHSTTKHVELSVLWYTPSESIVQCAHCLCFSIHIFDCWIRLAYISYSYNGSDAFGNVRTLNEMRLKLTTHSGKRHQWVEQLLCLSDDKGNVSALGKQAIQLQTELVSVQFGLVTSSVCYSYIEFFWWIYFQLRSVLWIVDLKLRINWNISLVLIRWSWNV